MDQAKLETLNGHHAKGVKKRDEREHLLKKEHGADGFERGMRLAKLTVPSKRLLEIRPLMTKAYENCALLRTIIKSE